MYAHKRAQRIHTRARICVTFKSQSTQFTDKTTTRSTVKQNKTSASQSCSLCVQLDPDGLTLWCSRKLLWTLMNKVWPISAYKPSFVRTHQPLHRGRYVIYQTPLADDPVPSYSSAFASLYWFNKELRERKRFLRMLKVPSKTTKAWPHYFFGQIFITAVNLSSTWIMQRALNSHLFLIELLVYPQTPHSEGWSQGQAVWCQLYAK